jgi:ABC-type nitrate/sulfonate/bicarbonate transport system substrate-binding protein
MRFRGAMALVVCAVIASLSACSTEPPPLQKMSVGITNRPFAALVAIADERGLFAEHGLDVDVRRYELGPPAIKDMLDGKIDVAMSADFGYANASFVTNDFRVVCGIAHDIDHQIATLTRSGITTPADLSGKRVGLPKGAAQFAFMLTRLLEESSVPTSSVTMVEIEPGRLAQALIDGEVDAIVTWRPIATVDRPVLDGHVDLIPMTGVGDTWSLLAMRPQTISARTTAVTDFLTALTQAQSWAESNPRNAIGLTRTYFEQPDVYSDGWPADALYVDLSQTALVRLEEEADWIASTTGRTPTTPMRDLVDSQLLSRIGPDLVTIPER